MDDDRRHKTPVSEMKDFITHSKRGSQCVNEFVLFSLMSDFHRQHGDQKTKAYVTDSVTRKEGRAKGPALFQQAANVASSK